MPTDLTRLHVDWNSFRNLLVSHPEMLPVWNSALTGTAANKLAFNNAMAEETCKVLAQADISNIAEVWNFLRGRLEEWGTEFSLSVADDDWAAFADTLMIFERLNWVLVFVTTVNPVVGPRN